MRNHHLTLIFAGLMGVLGPAVAAAEREAPLAFRADEPALRWNACPPTFPAGCALAVLQGDPAKPNADVFLRVPGGESLPPHRHSSAERIILVSGELRVHYEGSPATTLTAGSYAFGPAGLPHDAACLSKQPCTLFIAFEGRVDAEPVSGAIR